MEFISFLPRVKSACTDQMAHMSSLKRNKIFGQSPSCKFSRGWCWEKDLRIHVRRSSRLVATCGRKAQPLNEASWMRDRKFLPVLFTPRSSPSRAFCELCIPDFLLVNWMYAVLSLWMVANGAEGKFAVRCRMCDEYFKRCREISAWSPLTDSPDAEADADVARYDDDEVALAWSARDSIQYRSLQGSHKSSVLWTTQHKWNSAWLLNK